MCFHNFKVHIWNYHHPLKTFKFIILHAIMVVLCNDYFNFNIHNDFKLFFFTYLQNDYDVSTSVKAKKEYIIFN
jgi:hypothetical protein